MTVDCFTVCVRSLAGDDDDDDKTNKYRKRSKLWKWQISAKPNVFKDDTEQIIEILFLESGGFLKLLLETDIYDYVQYTWSVFSIRVFGTTTRTWPCLLYEFGEREWLLHTTQKDLDAVDVSNSLKHRIQWTLSGKNTTSLI